ncbi:MAG TPA: hypothetical protein PKW30_02725 [Campylobacterales bacterium]|nr:hypothetical protein [Campylobacterales bacterium]
MVSRTSVCLQIISLSLFGGDYYFTYSLTSKNIVASSEKLQISKKMTPTEAKPIKYFEISNDKYAKNEQEFVALYKDEITELILGQNAFIQSSSKTTNMITSDSSTLRSLPTLINIDFKEDFGIIGIYE